MVTMMSESELRELDCQSCCRRNDGTTISSSSRDPIPEICSTTTTPTQQTLLRLLHSPASTPLHRVVEVVKQKSGFHPQDAWFPITESRNGNACYAAFHNLNACIGFQFLVLPVAMASLGWYWGTVALLVAYMWQVFTLWQLIQMHEAIPGKRINRYVELAQEAFGRSMGLNIALPAVLNLTAGNGVTLIVVGGTTLKIFYETLCLDCHTYPSSIEWYLVFSGMCVLLVQLPNLNSIAGVSFVGAAMAVAYCTTSWLVSVTKPRPANVCYDALQGPSTVATAFHVFNSLGIVSFAFRGHNLVLEIQATMPSDSKHPSHVPMWKGSKVAYLVVALCYFPIAFAGYWAYGNLMFPEGIIFALYVYHGAEVARWTLATTFMLLVLNSLCCYQLYSIPAFDMLEQYYANKVQRKCSPLIRVVYRTLHVFFTFLIAIAFPFLSSFAGLVGGMNIIPVTFALPCFMWLWIMKPDKGSWSWWLNWMLGILGIVLSLLVSAGGIYSVATSGLQLNFFKPNMA